MASAISLEYLLSLLGQAEGIASLDDAGQIPSSQLPSDLVTKFKGQYADEAALIAAHATAQVADYAYVTDTQTYWYWSHALSTPAWVNQEISVTAYNALSTAEKKAVPYIIVP